MEENENVEGFDTQDAFQNAETVEDNNPINDSTKEVKSKKKLFIVIIIAVIAVLVIFNAIFNNTKAKAKKVVKEYIKAISKADAKKIMKVTDPFGTYVLSDLDEDDYEDFWKEYKEFIKEKDDEYEDLSDKWEDSQDNLEDLEDSLEDMLEDYTIKIKKFVSVKKEGKNLYRVKVKLETKMDGEKAETDTQAIYVMKKGMKCYIVGQDFI